jgi:hypothetical protein
MPRSNDFRIPAAVLGAALAAVLGAIGMYFVMRRREDAQWLDALTRRSGSDERRRGATAPRDPRPEQTWTDDPVGLQEIPVENPAIEPAPGLRISVIR